MQVLWLFWKNFLALCLGVVLALGLFYVVYNSDMLTADILQRQAESDKSPDILYSIDNGQVVVTSQRLLAADNSFTIKVNLQYDETQTTVFPDRVVSIFAHSFTQNNGQLAMELYGDREISADTELFRVSYDGDADHIVLGNVTVYLDGVEEILSVGTQPTSEGEGSVHY